MLQNYFHEDPLMKQAFSSLPGALQSAAVASGIFFGTPGELLLWAAQQQITPSGDGPRAPFSSESDSNGKEAKPE